MSDQPGFTESWACRLCGKTPIVEVLSIPATPLANDFVPARDLIQRKFPLSLTSCKCGAFQLRHAVDPVLLFKNYLYTTGSNPELVEHFTKTAKDHIDRFTLRPPSNQPEGPYPGDIVVSLGSNDGTDLLGFKDHGLEVLGVEPCERLALMAREKGVKTQVGFFSKGFPLDVPRPPKLIICNNTFAHIADLGGVLDGVREQIDPLKGIFVFEVAWAKSMLEMGAFDALLYHEHIFTHTVTALRPFFEAHGLKLFDVEVIPTHGGSIRGYARVGGSSFASVFTRMDEEKASGLFRMKTWEGFAKRITNTKIDLHNRIQTVRWARLNSGGTPVIAGYGAPAKLTPLCYALELGPAQIDYVVDDSPLKQGRYTPGLQIPVVPSERFFTEPPDLIVLFAWNIGERMAAKVRAMFEEKGLKAPPMVTPFPEVSFL